MPWAIRTFRTHSKQTTFPAKRTYKSFHFSCRPGWWAVEEKVKGGNNVGGREKNPKVFPLQWFTETSGKSNTTFPLTRHKARVLVVIIKQPFSIIIIRTTMENIYCKISLLWWAISGAEVLKTLLLPAYYAHTSLATNLKHSCLLCMFSSGY